MTITLTADTPQEIASLLQTLGGNALVTVATAAPAQPTPAKKETKATPTKELTKELVKETPAETTNSNSAITIEQVREAATRKIQADKKDEVKALLAECNVAKVTELQPAQYSYFLEKVNAL